MTGDPLSRIRDVALQLPGAHAEGGTFLVEGQPFAEVSDGTVRVRQADGDGWETIPLAGEPDWPMVEDRVARSWELTAPAGLLEAGGR